MAQVTSRHAHGLAVAAALACAMPAMQAVAQASPYQQALEAGWAGRYPEALRLIDAYLAQHPGDRAARLDRARFLAWRGDYAAAMEGMQGFAADDEEANALRARTLAWADRRDAALARNTPLYDAAPDDYDAAWTQALALRQGEWPHLALPALATVQATKPDAPDTIALARAVRLPLFSSVGAPLSVYDDSDDNRIRAEAVDGNVWLTDRWRLLLSAARREHSARLGGPFAPPGGGDSVDETRISAGLHVAPSADVGLEVWLGRSGLDYDGAAGDNAIIGRLSLAHYASDSLSYSVTVDRDRVDASPRALSVMRTGAWLQTRWTPTLRDTVAGKVTFEDFDDRNRRQSALVDYRHATWRGGTVMLDLGGQAEWQHNARNTGNGYYSPDRYVRVAPLASAYIALSPDAGLYLSAALGVQRDETFDGWKRAMDLNAELTLGIFSKWLLVGRAGYSQRINQFGQYEGTSIGLELRYRFCAMRAERCPGTE